MSEEIAASLTSGLAGPMVGALLVIGAWLLSKLKLGQPLGDQVCHALKAARPFAIPAIAAGGVYLMANPDGWVQALSIAIGSLLTAAGLTAPRQLPPEEPQ